MAPPHALAWLLLAASVVSRGAADDSLSVSSVMGMSPDVVGKVVVNTIESNLNVGSRRLIVMQDLPDVAQLNAPRICNGLPAIITYTPNIGSNGVCFQNSSQPNLQSNLSCTCLTYMDSKATEWTFRLRRQSSTKEDPLPPTQDKEDILDVDSTLIYGVSPSVLTLNILGVGDSPVYIELRTSPIPGASTTDPQLIISSAKAKLQTLRVENIDLGAYDLKRGFIPNRVENLTMKKCNLTSFSTDLLSNMGKLKSLDLSNNLLKGVYQDITEDTCVASYCPITSLNLSYNEIEAFPKYLLNMKNLEYLSLKGNALSNFTVEPAVLDSLEQLTKLELDPQDGGCIVGTETPVANTRVCVLNITTEATTPPPASATESSSNSSYLMYGVIGGCIIIAVLVFALVRKRNCSSLSGYESDKEPVDVYFDNTFSYDDTHPTVSASLLNDPIIITNRIPYKDLRVANCISKGGFGLVYSGVYNRRRVAIKKIRPDRAGDIKQIESFLKEICLIATLNHPRVVEFIGVSWDSLRNLCAVTEFMERGDLREVLHGFKLRNTPLTWESHKTTIALHIAEGLTYLHSLSPKVIHRDLKSKNVLLNGEMHAKLSDFGISRERHLEETHMTAGIGTSFWIAPEVLLGKDYDERADIFSFGVVLSEIDTDDYPYWNASNPNVGNKAQENMILQMVASGAMRPSFSDSCPPAVLELADLCLQLDPENRPTAAEVAYELQRIISALSPVAHVDFSTSGF